MSAPCGHHFHPKHECGKSVLVGTSFAEHLVSCPDSSMNRGKEAPLGGGEYRPRDQYAASEAPAGHCPICWHAALRSSDQPTIHTEARTR